MEVVDEVKFGKWDFKITKKDGNVGYSVSHTSGSVGDIKVEHLEYFQLLLDGNSYIMRASSCEELLIVMNKDLDFSSVNRFLGANLKVTIITVVDTNVCEVDDCGISTICSKQYSIKTPVEFDFIKPLGDGIVCEILADVTQISGVCKKSLCAANLLPIAGLQLKIASDKFDLPGQDLHTTTCKPLFWCDSDAAAGIATNTRNRINDNQTRVNNLNNNRAKLGC
jgi:hypothetical protein